MSPTDLLLKSVVPLFTITVLYFIETPVFLFFIFYLQSMIGPSLTEWCHKFSSFLFSPFLDFPEFKFETTDLFITITVSLYFKVSSLTNPETKGLNKR